jgi:thymidine phosphorylase
VRLGDIVRPGQPLFTLHAQAPGELAYALQYVASRPAIFQLSEGS